MRTISLVAGLLLIFSISLSANNAPFPGKFKVRTTVENQSTLKLSMVNLQLEKTVVTLHDLSSNESLYKEVIQDHNGYRMALNLNELPTGRYVLSVKKGDTHKRQVVNVLSNMILLSQFSDVQ